MDLLLEQSVSLVISGTANPDAMMIVARSQCLTLAILMDLELMVVDLLLTITNILCIIAIENNYLCILMIQANCSLNILCYIFYVLHIVNCLFINNLYAALRLFFVFITILKCQICLPM